MKYFNKLLIQLFLLVYAAISCQGQLYEVSGPFRVGEKEFSFTDATLPSGNQRITGRIFFPAHAANTNELANDTFPVVAFGHGFNISYLSYRNIYRHLASWGYVVISPDVQNGINVNHRIFAQQLAACIKYLKKEGQTAGSFYFQKIASTSACMGHSMGGGSSFLVASVFDSVTALVGLAPAETNPSAVEVLKSNSVPILIISGSSDNTTPESQHQAPMYSASPASKLWISLRGGAHCKFTDGPTICDLVSSPGTISREEQLTLTRKYITPFLGYYLKNISDAKTYICGDSILADSASGRLQFFTNISCTPPTHTFANELTNSFISCYPTIFTNKFVVQVREDGIFRIFNSKGKQLFESFLVGTGNYYFNLDDSEEGLLIWYFQSSNKVTQGKLIKMN
ncbi:MAG: dienelactone hydrolase family protein [Bacteroidia bacterium]|nr:dienelactone hydrolase family protein [Bacteroidia bacterium]